MYLLANFWYNEIEWEYGKLKGMEAKLCNINFRVYSVDGQVTYWDLTKRLGCWVTLARLSIILIMEFDATLDNYIHF